jgi:hypothetical protein
MQRFYKGFTIYRHAGEKTLSVWQNGQCLESGFRGINAAREWIRKQWPPLFSVWVPYRRPSGKISSVTGVERAKDAQAAIACVMERVNRWPERRRVAQWLPDQARARPIPD